MQSTGEVACFGDSFFDAFCKALASSGYKIPMQGNVFVSFGGTELKRRTLNSVRKLQKWVTRFLQRNTQPNFSPNTG